MLSLAEKGTSDPGVEAPSGMSILGTPLEVPFVAVGMLGGEFSRTGRPMVSADKQQS